MFLQFCAAYQPDHNGMSHQCIYVHFISICNFVALCHFNDLLLLNR